jgi:hypothetical protein
MSVYSVRSLLVSQMLTVQAACSPIRLLTPQGLDLERALPGGCMTTPPAASSAIAYSARTDGRFCACEHSQLETGDVHTQRGGAVDALGSLRVSLPCRRSFPFRSRFSHFAL